MAKPVKSTLISLSTLFAMSAGQAVAQDSSMSWVPPENERIILRAMQAMVADDDTPALEKLANGLRSIFSIPNFDTIGAIPNNPLGLPLMEKTPARAMLKHALALVSQDSESMHTLNDFLNRGGKIYMFNMPWSALGYYDHDESGYWLYLNAGEGADVLTMTFDHELRHHDRNIRDTVVPDSIDTPTTSLRYIDYFQYRFFDEALAQTKATDFAYQLYLQGKSGPLQSVLNMGLASYSLSADGLDVPEEEISYIKAIALAYLREMYEWPTMPDNVTLDQLKEKDAGHFVSPYQTRRSMAQASAFKAWLEDGGLGMYEDDTTAYLEETYLGIGRDEKSQEWSNAPVPYQLLGQRVYKPENLKAETVIDGVNFYRYLPSNIASNAYMQGLLREGTQAKVGLMNEAADNYYQHGILPVQTFSPDVVLYAQNELDEYSASGMADYLHSVATYQDYKKTGLLDYAAGFVTDGQTQFTSLTLQEYAQAVKDGKIPPVQYESTYGGMLDIWDDDLMNSDPTLYQSTRFAERILAYSQSPIVYQAGIDALHAIVQGCDVKPLQSLGCVTAADARVKMLTREALGLESTPDQIRDAESFRLSNAVELEARLNDFSAVLKSQKMRAVGKKPTAPNPY